MTNRERFRLLFGPYTTPRFRYGQVVADEARDCDVTIVGLSNARMPWPLGWRGGSRARGLVVFDPLADAVRRESGQAIAYWWGVTAQAETVWRKALAVRPTTEGTSQLRSDYAYEEPLVQARKKAHKKARDPQRRAKIAAQCVAKGGWLM
jgi:hypothetical protein